jgi:hypothetical protein
MSHILWIKIYIDEKFTQRIKHPAYVAFLPELNKNENS